MKTKGKIRAFYLCSSGQILLFIVIVNSRTAYEMSRQCANKTPHKTNKTFMFVGLYTV